MIRVGPGLGGELMDDIKRITPAEVRAAYKDTGLKPARGIFYWPRNPTPWSSDVSCAREACGLGVVAVQRTFTKMDQEWNVENVAKYLGLSLSYVAGYVRGFDHYGSLHTPKNPHRPGEAPYAAWTKGYQDGRDAGAEMFPDMAP